MPNLTYLVNRRRFLATTAAVTGTIAMPSILRAQGAPVKLGVLHPVTGLAEDFFERQGDVFQMRQETFVLRPRQGGQQRPRRDPRRRG